MARPNATACPRVPARLAAACLCAALAACSEGTGPREDPFAFQPPIVGEPMVDVFYGAYKDHEPGPGARDYACGPKAYPGHQGVDVLLRNFRVQDSGVAVLAAAAGLVVRVVDSMSDRNSSLDPLLGFGNHVVLLHDDAKESIYAHLRRGSIAVDVGERVETGSMLGLVGSSGYSNWPHLHFEVREAGSVLEPFAGECGPAASLWAAQLPYQDAFAVTDAGITDLDPGTLEVLLERPPTLAELPLDFPSFRFWVQVVNQPAATVRMEVRGPGGQRPHAVSGSTFPSYSMRYMSVRIPVAGVLFEPGDWAIETFQNDSLIWTHPFRLVHPPVAAARHPAGRGPAPDPDAFRIQFADNAPALPPNAPDPRMP